MEKTFRLEIVTPERNFIDEDAEVLIFNSKDGEIGILAGHIPFVVAVDTGVIKIKKDNEWLEAIVSEGFAEVKQDRTILLVDTAEWPNEIDINRAKAARERASERLNQQLSRIEYVRSKAALARAVARIKAGKTDI